MVCPYCANISSVTNSRTRHRRYQTWRRRKCHICHAVWTTHEIYDYTTTHRVRKSRSRRVEPFSRDLLLLSIYDALRHRKHAYQEAGSLTDTVVMKILIKKEPIISSDDIRIITLTTLESFDEIAGALYASAHRTHA